MRALAVAAIALLALVEIPLVLGRGPWWSAAAVVLAILVLALCRLALRTNVPEDTPEPLVESESLQRWRKRTEALISWADGSRADWDQHLRPLLVRELRKSATHGDDAATGLMVFGPQLWPWVDPSTVASAADAARPGPGRAVLGAILDRLDTR